MGNKDILVYRILSGRTKIRVNSQTFFVKGNTAAQKYLAEEIFQQLYEEYLEDLKSDEDLLYWLVKNKYWSQAEEEKMGKFKKDIEEFQVKLFELGFQGEERVVVKKAIALARQRIKELSNKKHQFDGLSARGVALVERNKFLIGLGLTDESGQHIFTEYNYFKLNFSLFDRIIVEFNRKMIEGAEYREIARTEPWRQYWSAKEGTSSVFDVPATQLTDEQLTLISWTRLYDSVFQHPECPSDNVIEDDDALDGFLIKDKRKRDKEKDGATVDGMINDPKIKNAQEIFIMANTDNDASRIQNLNSDASKQTLRKRDDYIEKHGSAKEADLPDVKKRRKMAIAAAQFKG